LGIACAALAEAGLAAVAMPLAALPRDPAALARLRQSWLRDAMIHQLALVLVGDDNRHTAPVELLGGWGTPVLVVGASLPAAACGMRIALEAAGDVHLALWSEALGGSDGDLAARLAHTFRLPAAQIRAIGEANRSPAEVWAAARAAARPWDEGLYQRIAPRVALGDVVVPD